MDIRELAALQNFDLDTQSLGKLRCTTPDKEQQKEIDEELRRNDLDSFSFASKLFSFSARKRTGDEKLDKHAKGDALTEEEVGSVTWEELDTFCKKFVEHRRYMLKSQTLGKLEKKPNESNMDFLVNAYRHYGKDKETHFKGMASRFLGQVLPASSLAALKINEAVSENLGRTIDGMRSTAHGSVKIRDLPAAPRSAFAQTNGTLEEILEHHRETRTLLIESAQIIKSLNDTAVTLQTDYVVNNKKSGRATFIATFIAAASLLVSAYLSWITLKEAREGGKKTEEQLQQVHQDLQALIAAQKKGQELMDRPVSKEKPQKLSATR
ncbi:hypothetical protein ACFQUU_08505 [Herbaspirillum sp. GCM10030257]|uniref:hypothetical protein n=1 Tax=Herbaspirillum sp. GCM10030257 TaxID=3273393 RepID=UPI0036235285